MPINKSFRNSEEIIRPSDLITKSNQSYDAIIITFQSKVLDKLLENKLVKEADDKKFGTGYLSYPVYKLIESPNILFYLCPISAATAVGILEGITYAYDIKKIISYGSCGVLDKNITGGKLIVPTKSYRDEGTSYHYKESSDFIDMKNEMFVSNVMKKLNIDFVKGFIWTTDGFYRETKEIYEERKKAGCIAVEMEISAIEAFCHYRKYDLYTFVYGADNLDSKSWDKRVLGNLDLDIRLNQFLVAYEIAKEAVK